MKGNVMGNYSEIEAWAARHEIPANEAIKTAIEGRRYVVELLCAVNDAESDARHWRSNHDRQVEIKQKKQRHVRRLIAERKIARDMLAIVESSNDEQEVQMALDTLRESLRHNFDCLSSEK